jgi:hypothetical protein
MLEERVKGLSRTDQDRTNPYADQAVERAILLALEGIRFGSVEIIVHDSRVVQIERKEKTRFDGTVSRPVR